MENKEKIILFLCDISGTFSANPQNNDNDKYYKELSRLLEEKIKLAYADKIIFSFITAEENPIKLIQNMIFFNNYVSSDDIIIGKCFMQNQCIVPNNDKTFTSIQNKKFDIQDKINKIKCYINEIKNIYDIVELCVADDFANETWIDNLKESSENINVNIFIPSHPKSLNPNVYTSFYTDITGLVDAIEKSIAPSTTFYDKDEKQDLKK